MFGENESEFEDLSPVLGSSILVAPVEGLSKLEQSFLGSSGGSEGDEVDPGTELLILI